MIYVDEAKWQKLRLIFKYIPELNKNKMSGAENVYVISYTHTHTIIVINYAAILIKKIIYKCYVKYELNYY